MKNIIFVFSMLVVAITGYSQEVILEAQTYVPYQDSLFVIKTTRVLGTGYEGLNDTLVSYSAPTDTSGLVTQLKNSYLNSVNTATARLRAAKVFKTTLLDYAAESAIIAALGVSLDSLMVSLYEKEYTGRWRVFRPDNTSFFVDIAKHPTLPGLMRATGTNAEGNFNVLLYAKDYFRIAFGGELGTQYLMWNGNSTDQLVYQNPAAIIAPSPVGTFSTVRMVKVH